MLKWKWRHLIQYENCISVSDSLRYRSKTRYSVIVMEHIETYTVVMDFNLPTTRVSMPVLILSIRSVSYRNQQYNCEDMCVCVCDINIKFQYIPLADSRKAFHPSPLFSDIEKSCILLNHVFRFIFSRLKKASLTRHKCFLNFSLK